MILRKHRHERDFTIIANPTIQDSRLSWKATGILTFLLSLPDNWRVDGRDLAKRKKGGRDAVYSGMKELEECGYLVREKVRCDDGRWETHVHVYEVPPSGKSDTDSGFSGPGSPGPGDPGAKDQGLDTKDPEQGTSAPAAPDAPNFSDDVVRLANLLADLMVENGCRRPAITVSGFLDPIRLLIDRDGIEPDRVERAIRWAQGDEFWRANIHSGRALRAKFDTLRQQAARKLRGGAVEQARKGAEAYLERRTGDS